MKKVYAIMDSDGDWFVIPIELKDKFLKLDELCGDENWSVALNSQDEFNDTFNQYRTGGDLNNIQLYAEI